LWWELISLSAQSADFGNGLSGGLLVHRFVRLDDVVERHAREARALRGDAGVLGGRFPVVQGQRRRALAQLERYEVGVVLIDLAA
jgi:hypothetical protein